MGKGTKGQIGQNCEWEVKDLELSSICYEEPLKPCEQVVMSGPE